MSHETKTPLTSTPDGRVSPLPTSSRHSKGPASFQISTCMHKLPSVLFLSLLSFTFSFFFLFYFFFFSRFLFLFSFLVFFLSFFLFTWKLLDENEYIGNTTQANLDRHHWKGSFVLMRIQRCCSTHREDPLNTRSCSLQLKGAVSTALHHSLCTLESLNFWRGSCLPEAANILAVF